MIHIGHKLSIPFSQNSNMLILFVWGGGGSKFSRHYCCCCCCPCLEKGGRNALASVFSIPQKSGSLNKQGHPKLCLTSSNLILASKEQQVELRINQSFLQENSACRLLIGNGYFKPFTGAVNDETTVNHYQKPVFNLFDDDTIADCRAREAVNASNCHLIQMQHSVHVPSYSSTSTSFVYQVL